MTDTPLPSLLTDAELKSRQVDAAYENGSQTFLACNKREFFAAAALTGLCANSAEGGYTPRGAAKQAVAAADELLLLLEQT
jgi:hypothetical protein